MSTTNLFVELVVIGVGAAVWVSLLVMAGFGWEWIPLNELLSAPAFVPLFSVVYVLGIVSDRVADMLFEALWTPRLRAQYFSDTSEYHHARRVVLVHSDRLANLMEYGRSRLRICRGWALNTLLMAISLNVFIWIRIPDSTPVAKISSIGTVSLVGLSYLLWYAWRAITRVEYLKLIEHARYLESVVLPSAKSETAARA